MINFEIDDLHFAHYNTYKSLVRIDTDSIEHRATEFALWFEEFEL